MERCVIHRASEAEKAASEAVRRCTELQKAHETLLAESSQKQVHPDLSNWSNMSKLNYRVAACAREAVGSVEGERGIDASAAGGDKRKAQGSV